LHDPNSLPDIEIIVARLSRAIQNGERILVFGDYDVDGITSTALLLRTLRALGALVDYRLPERHEGYGLGIETVETAKAAGFSLLMTADCGITAVEPAKRAREIGLDLVITDHHECGLELPDALAVVNPKRPDSSYPFVGLSGCGVAFKVMQALITAHQPKALASFEAKFWIWWRFPPSPTACRCATKTVIWLSPDFEQLYGTRKRGPSRADRKRPDSRQRFLHRARRVVWFGAAPQRRRTFGFAHFSAAPLIVRRRKRMSRTRRAHGRVEPDAPFADGNRGSRSRANRGETGEFKSRPLADCGGNWLASRRGRTHRGEVGR
jgi:hypothetical protein